MLNKPFVIYYYKVYNDISGKSFTLATTKKIKDAEEMLREKLKTYTSFKWIETYAISRKIFLGGSVYHDVVYNL